VNGRGRSRAYYWWSAGVCLTVGIVTLVDGDIGLGLFLLGGAIVGALAGAMRGRRW
jgi:hypothetical protein